MPAPGLDGGRWPLELLTLVERLGGSTLEVGVHPGLDESWRAGEKAGVELLSREARAAGHELVTWRQV
jgi:hypothetical protein